MKKFFTVLLTLVVVFAFTGSAMAAGWNQEVSTAEPKDEFKLSIAKLEYNSTAGAIGGAYWKEYTGSVVKNTMVRALVTLEIPAKDKLSDVVAANLDDDALKLQFKGKNIKITSVEQYIGNSKNDLGAVTTIPGGSPGTTYQYMIVGVVEDDGDAAIEATLSFGVPFRDGKFSYNYAGDLYTVTHSGNTFNVSDNKTGVVIFEVDSTSRIKSIKVVDVKGETCEYLYKPTGEVALPEAHQKVIQKIYASLGFTFDGVFGYIHEQGFIATHGHGFTMTQVANYNGSVAVPTPDQIMLPQTGDAPNIVGFAMLGAAVVACAIIVIRKKIYN